MYSFEVGAVYTKDNRPECGFATCTNYCLQGCEMTMGCEMYDQNGCRYVNDPGNVGPNAWKLAEECSWSVEKPDGKMCSFTQWPDGSIARSCTYTDELGCTETAISTTTSEDGWLLGDGVYLFYYETDSGEYVTSGMTAAGVGEAVAFTSEETTVECPANPMDEAYCGEFEAPTELSASIFDSFPQPSATGNNWGTSCIYQESYDADGGWITCEAALTYQTEGGSYTLGRTCTNEWGCVTTQGCSVIKNGVDITSLDDGCADLENAASFSGERCDTDR